MLPLFYQSERMFMRLLLFHKSSCMYMFMWRIHTHTVTSQDNLGDLVFCFYFLGPKIQGRQAWLQVPHHPKHLTVL